MYNVSSFITTDKQSASQEKRMSICLTSNGFSFSVVADGAVLLSFGTVDIELRRPLYELTADIKSVFSSCNISTLDMRSMELVLPAESFVWVPAVVYDVAQRRAYLEAVGRVPSDCTVCSVFDSAVDAHLVFAVPDHLLTAFKVALPGIDVCAVPYKLANAGLLQRSSSHPLIVAHLSEARDGKEVNVDYMAANNGRMLLSVRRSVSDNRQLLRLSLDIMKQLGIEQADLELLLCGAVDREIYGALCNYFPHVDLYNGQPYSFVNPEFRHLHTYRHVLNLVD